MISDTHVKQIRKIKGAEIVGVCDKEEMMAEQLAERHRIPTFYSDMNKMLKDLRPDIVHILTPPTTHLKVCLCALNSGCHILVEKPFTSNFKEAELVIKKAISSGKKLTVNHFHNFSPPALKTRKLISNGSLGDIVHLESYYGYRIDSPAVKTLLSENQSWLYALPGKVFHNNISHLLYKLVNIMPNKELKAYAIGYLFQNGIKSFNTNQIDDELRLIITDGKISAYATFSANIEPLRQYLTVFGTKQTLMVDYESRAVVHWPATKLPGPFGKLASPILLSKSFLSESISNIIKFLKFDFHYYSGMNKLLKLFYNCIQNDSAPPISYFEILSVSALIDDIFEQLYGSN